jgi:hypothetical protein
MTDYSNNVFLGQSKQPQNVVVNSLTALDLDPDLPVWTNENKKLISFTGHVGPTGPVGSPSELNVNILKKFSQLIPPDIGTVITSWEIENNDGYVVDVSGGTITIPEDGIYTISYVVPWSSSTTVSKRGCTILINGFGSLNLATSELLVAGGAGLGVTCNGNSNVKLNKDDVITLQALHTATTDVNCCGPATFQYGVLQVSKINGIVGPTGPSSSSFDTISGNGIILLSTINSIQLPNLSRSEIEDFADLNPSKSGLLVFNTETNTIDTQFGSIVSTSHQTPVICPVYDLRFRLTFNEQPTYFQKFLCPCFTTINRLLLYFGTRGGGNINIAIYDDATKLNIYQGTPGRPNHTNEFGGLAFNTDLVLNNAYYWIGFSQTNGAAADWSFGMTCDDVAGGGGEVGFRTTDIGFKLDADYSAGGFPAVLPSTSLIATGWRLWFNFENAL